MKLNRIVTAALFGVAGVAFAQFQPPTFDSLDADANGALSKSEVEGFFAQLERRGGGRRPPPGSEAGGPPSAEDMFAQWDVDGDGSVSKDEFESRPRMGPGGPGRPRGNPPPR